MSRFANMSGQTNWCLSRLKCPETIVDHSKSRNYQPKNFTRKKVKAKKAEKLAPKSSLSTDASSPQTKSGRTLPDCFCLFVCFLFVFLFREGGGQRSIFINQVSLPLFADYIFSK